MTSVRRNIASNIIGNFWVVLLTAIIVPMQINYLGMEAFGLIGLIATLQLIFNVLDLGLSSTITRTIASDISGNKESSRCLVNTAMLIYWFIALFLAIIVFFNSDLIVQFILKESSLPMDTITIGIIIIGLSVAARWPIALYNGIFSGIQRQDVLNIIKITNVSLRLIGGIVLILLTNDLLIFLGWVLFAAIVEVASCHLLCKKYAPIEYFKISFDLESVKNVWKFSIAMNVIAILSMILVNIDKLFVSKFLSLEDLGYYYLAYNIAMCISLIQTSINSALYPSFSQDYSVDAKKIFNEKYINITQLTIFITALPACLMIFYGYEGLVLWVGEKAALESYKTLSILAVGFFIIAVVSNSYIASIAVGKPYISVLINLVAIIFYVPLMYLMIINYGIIGAAYSWLILNLYYLFVQMPIIYAVALGIKYIEWISKKLMPYVILGLICFGGIKYTINAIDYNNYVVTTFALMLSLITYLFLGYNMLPEYVRGELRKYSRI